MPSILPKSSGNIKDIIDSLTETEQQDCLRGKELYNQGLLEEAIEAFWDAFVYFRNENDYEKADTACWIAYEIDSYI